MSYIVFARKYRPQTFDEVIGQEHVTVTLKNAIKANRLAHAYIFSGPRGVGKTTTARILAKALNCQEGPTQIPCNRCSPCVEITESRSLDVLEIDGASNRGIDEVRALREKAKYVSTLRYKIYIIDEVHMLTTPAFNALLKTLEEPPQHVIFIFATTEPHKVLPTILSRCQRFDFRRIRTEEILRRLSFIAKEEKLQVEEEAKLLIAGRADGSLRDAEGMLDQLISFAQGGITAADVKTFLGLGGLEAFFNLTKHILAGDRRATLLLVEEVVDLGYDLKEFVSGLIEHLRYLLLAKLGVIPEVVTTLPQETLSAYLEQSAQTEEGNLLRMLRILFNLERALRISSQPRVLLESEIVKLAGLDPWVRMEDILEKAKALRLEVETGTEPEENQQNASTTQDLQGVWRELLLRMEKRKRYLTPFLAKGEPLKLEGGFLTIGYPKEEGFLREQIEREKNRRLVEDELSEIVGGQMRLKLTHPQMETGKPEPPAAIGRPEDLPAHDSPVERAVRILDGEVIDR